MNKKRIPVMNRVGPPSRWVQMGPSQGKKGKTSPRHSIKEPDIGKEEPERGPKGSMGP